MGRKKSKDSVLRVERNRNYKTIGLEGVNDRGLSLKAKGLHTMLITRPNGWNFSIMGIVTLCRDGKDGVKSAVQELKDAGYLKIAQERGEDGTFGAWIWTISECRMEPSTESGFSASGETASGSTASGKPGHVVIEDGSKEGCSTPPTPPQGGTQDDLPEAFMEFWREYPARTPSNPRGEALRAWRARMKEGVDPGEIMAGLRRYVAYLTATGRVGTEYVQQGSTFLGRKRSWEEPWTIPANGNGNGNGLSRADQRLLEHRARLEAMDFNQRSVFDGD